MSASDAPPPFGISAYLAHLHAAASSQAIAAELAKVLSVLGENDPAAIAELVKSRVTNAGLYDLRLWNARLAWNPLRDRVGHAATLFWAAQTLVTTVMRANALDASATYPAAIDRAIAKGAEGLFEVGQSQFDALVLLADEVVSWLANKNPRAIALIESPIGNTVPVQFLSDLAATRSLRTSVVQWNAPRNDRTARGRTVHDAAEDCARALAEYEIVVLLDETFSGSRFIKLFDALADRIGRDRFLPIAMLFGDTFRPALESNPNRQRLSDKLQEQGKRIGFPDCVRAFPPQRLFKFDSGAYVRWQSAVIWGDSDLIAGKRKVNLIFVIIDHCFDLLHDLAAEDSKFRPYLELAWSQNTKGTTFVFSPGLLQQFFRDVVDTLQLEDLRRGLSEQARERFPADYTGDIAALNKIGALERWMWFRETFVRLAQKRLDVEHAWTAWNAIDATFAASFPDRKPEARRDLDATAYTLPFNATICAFNRTLRQRLVQRLAELQTK
jgi:hypothetical protein